MDPVQDPELLLPIEVIELNDDVITVFVRGEVDLTESGELRAVLADACAGPHHRIVIDLSGVGFIGSSGMGVLAQQSAELEAAGRHLQVTGTPERIRRSFEVIGLDQVLDLT
ncbi:MAG: STAS domain-containing protein [Acidimicrobiales bacterium]